MVKAESEYTEHMAAQGHEEKEEEPIVSSAYTIVHPWTVMVERL